MAWLVAVATPAGAQICGDADGNGTVTDTDAVLAFRQAANLPSPCKELACDADGDGTITEIDAIRILRKASGLAVVERCGRGNVSGRVIVGATGELDQLEREPNDVASAASVVGRLGNRETRSLRGRVDPSTDPLDGYVVLVDAPVTLTLEVRFRGRSADVDLLVADARLETALTCESSDRDRERCEVHLDPDDDTRAFHVVVAAAAGSAPTPYTLTIETSPGPRAAGGLEPGAGADIPRALSPAVYAGREADFVPGELIVQPMDTPPPARAGTDGSTHTAAALAASGVTDAWQPVAVSPSGAALYVHAEATAAARAASTRDGTKRARAALRRQTLEAVALLRANPAIRWAQPNYLARVARIPNDPLLPRQWHYRLLGLEDAWDLTIGNDGVIVAVVDTGIRSDHPDLEGRLVPGYDFIVDRWRANDGDGLDPDPFDPGDMPGSPLEGSFHGTHVTGTIAAVTDNGRGVAGVTWSTRVMPLRALGVGGGSTFDIAEAIRFAAGLENISGQLPAEPAAVINLSLVAFGDDPFMRAAVDAATEAGALVVAAAGNTASDVVVSPAIYENSLAVTALDALGAPARYAAFGGAVDVSAPGGDTGVDLNADGETDGVLSTVLPGSRDFVGFQGTSMAAAHVSGVAALMLALGGPADPATLRAALLASTDDRGAPGRDDRYGAGLVDPAAAVRLYAGLPAPAGPVLALDTAAMSFGSTRASLPLHTRNAGGGVLTLAWPTASTTDGIPWLSARLDADPSLVTVTVDRHRLVPGDYAGQIVVPSNAGTATMTVVMTVPEQPLVDIGPVTVVLLDPVSSAPAAAVTTTFATNYSYRLEGVRGGEYELRASTDRDRDGKICDTGEFCGAFPTLDAPATVTVTGGRTLQDLDFVLGPVTIDP